MADKKKPAKKADKPKKKEAPNKDRKPSKVYKSPRKMTSIDRDEIAKRGMDRINAVVRAAGILKNLGYVVDRGNSLVIVPRLKLMLAFDSMDMNDSLQKNADISGYKLIHIAPDVFKSKQHLTTFLTEATNLLKSQEVPPKKIRRSKKLQKSVDKNISRV